MKDNSIQQLLQAQKNLRNLLFNRPYNLSEIETNSVVLCDLIIDVIEQEEDSNEFAEWCSQIGWRYEWQGKEWVNVRIKSFGESLESKTTSELKEIWKENKK